MPVTDSPTTTDGVDRRTEMARALARGGMEDVHVLSLDSAEIVLTRRRREILEVLRAEEIASVRELARRLDRDKAQVSRDLQVLAEHAVIHYETDGRAKAPRLSQSRLVIEPIV